MARRTRCSSVAFALEIGAAAVASLACMLVEEGTCCADVAWWDVGAAYPLVLGDGSQPTDYRGVVKAGGRIGITGDRSAEPAGTLAFGLDHVALVNKVLPAAETPAGYHHIATASATTFMTYFGMAAQPSARVLWAVYGGAGLSWRSFQDVDGLAMAGLFSVDTLCWFILEGSDDSNRGGRFFLGPDLELGILTEGYKSNIGSVSFLSGGLRFGVLVK